MVDDDLAVIVVFLNTMDTYLNAVLEKIDDPVQIAEKVSAFPRKARYM